VARTSKKKNRMRSRNGSARFRLVTPLSRVIVRAMHFFRRSSVFVFFVAFASGSVLADENKPSPAPHHGEALPLLAKAKAAALEIKQPENQIAALRKIAAVQAAAGDMDGFRATIDKAKELAAQLDGDKGKSKPLYLITYAQIKAGDLAGARKTADAIPDYEIHNNALTDIGVAQAQSGDIDGALATADAIKNAEHFNMDYSKGQVIVAAAFAQLKNGGREKAWKTIAGIKDEEVRAWGLSDLATKQAKAGDVDGALATLDLTNLKTSRYRFRWTEAMCEVGIAQAKAGRFEEAMAVADKLDQHEKEKVLVEIATAQAGKGDLAAAQATAEKIREGSEKDDAMIEIGRAHV